jgi:hypothetical protein
MRSNMLRTTLLSAILLSGGCGLFGGGNDGGTGGGDQPDFAGAPPGSDLSLPDLTLTSKQIDVAWTLVYSELIADPNHGFSEECDAPDGGVIMQLKFTVTNQTSHQSVSTSAPCPAAMSSGRAVLDLPDTNGPFTIVGSAVGKADSGSKPVVDVMPNSSVTVHIEVAGCPMGMCP